MLDSEFKRNSAFTLRPWDRITRQEISNPCCVLLCHRIFRCFLFSLWWERGFGSQWKWI